MHKPQSNHTASSASKKSKQTQCDNNTNHDLTPHVRRVIDASLNDCDNNRFVDFKF